MASVYLRPRSKVFQCSFYIPTEGRPKEVRRTTGQTSRREAERVAQELENAARQAAGVTSEKGRAIHTIINAAGEDALRERLTVAKAREYMARILKIANGEDLPEFTIEDWVREWLTRKEPLVSKATIERYRISSAAFLRWLGTNAAKPLESVTTTHLRKYRDFIRKGRTANTVNNYLKDLSSIFGAAIDEGLTLSNPARALKSLPHDDSTPRAPFSPGEVRRLVEAAPTRDWRGVILLSAFSGLRLGDCARLEWGAVDLAAGTIRVTPVKTQRKRVEVQIPIHGDLRAYLEGHPISDDSMSPVFPSLSELKVSGKTGLSMAFGRIMDEAGVSRGEKSPSGMHQRGFHALRHSFTSWLANAGVSKELRQAMTGHLDDTSHKLYTHHAPESLKTAVDRLPSLAIE